MKCKIECSFGEIIDKLTILTIKKEKVSDTQQRKNIYKEYDVLEKYYIKDDVFFENLYSQLLEINRKLWVMEDTIRYLSSLKQYDKTFIKVAENIHIMNDERYKVKKQINLMYDSEICEEKIYVNKESQNNKIVNNDSSDWSSFEINENQIKNFSNLRSSFKTNFANKNEDFESLEQVKSYYNDDKIEKSYFMTKTLFNKYDVKGKMPENTRFQAELYFTYLIYLEYKIETQNQFFLKDFEEKLTYILNNINLFFEDQQSQIQAHSLYGKYLLNKKKYYESRKYVIFLEPSTYPRMNIYPNTMSYFRLKDISLKNKTLLIYCSGGLGDIIMYSRFIPRVCSENNQHKILFVVPDCLYWMLYDAFKGYSNLKIIKSSIKETAVTHFDYHTNLNMICHYLNLNYNDIYEYNYLEYIQPEVNTQINTQINNLFSESKKNIGFHWIGSSTSGGKSRNVDLKILSKLFLNLDVNWISLQKNINEYDKCILQEFENVHNLSDKIDKSENAFYDTLGILRKLDMFITNDTSLVHLCGTDRSCKCIVLLPVNNDWRWTNDEKTNWYPQIKLMRQNTYGDWKEVIEKVQNEIKMI